MSKDGFKDIFTPQVLSSLLPENIADAFFEALFGDASEGAYDIKLAFNDYTRNSLRFDLQMIQCPGKCLGCHLTYGLPQVFSRHPVINLKGLVKEIETLLNGHGSVKEWQLGATREISRELHVIPLTIHLAD